MMGQFNRDQGQLFYCFNLEEVVPGDHLVRAIAAVLDLSWVRAELAPHYSPMGRPYSPMGRPSIDPLLMIRMLIVGYVFAIGSKRALCREVQVNLACRWFCGLGIEARFLITPCFHVRATSVSAITIFFVACLNALSRRVLLVRQIVRAKLDPPSKL
ncbi:MAG TPA: transposase [Terracidiphilus sp.]|nr:transposase [Terracidiphilus sp.]